jgi:hypothetical protein
MKRLYSTLAVILAVAAINAQITVVYQVDITNYLDNGNVLGPNGMRVGGNFSAYGATNDGVAMADWTPSGEASAMTDLGNNVWSITVTYPAASIGAEQLYKFVNNDWGTNEGTDAENTIGADGCGLDDGAGNVNRTLTIPATSAGLQYCFDACFTCSGDDPEFTPTGLNELVKVSGMTVGPNPAEDQVTFKFNLDNRANVRLSLINILGSEVAVISNGTRTAGPHQVNYDLETLANGSYFYRLQAGEILITGNLIKF